MKSTSTNISTSDVILQHQFGSNMYYNIILFIILSNNDNIIVACKTTM